MSMFKSKQKILCQIAVIIVLIILSNEPIYVLSQSAHNDFATVAISPDGTKIVGGGSNGLLRLWDATTGQVLQDFTGVTQAITSVAWSPDGSRIASGGSDTIVRVWDLNGTLLSSMDDHKANIMSVAWSPDEIYIASASFTGPDGYSLRIWDGTTYSLLHEYSAGSINSLAWHPNRHEIALAGQNGYVYTVTVSSSGVEYTQLSYQNSTAMMSVAWNSDGTRLATGDAEGTITIWNPATFDTLVILTGHTSYVEALVWSPNDSQLASASADGTIRTWDVNSGENIDVFQNPKETITTSIDWDGNLLTFGQADAQIKTIVFPTADAGPDQTVTTDEGGFATVTLDGSASSDPDGTITGYAWTLDGVEIATGVNPQVELGIGVHEIILTVTDDEGATGSDVVVITVEAE